MQIHNRGRVARYQDLRHGAVFIINVRDTNYVCIKTYHVLDDGDELDSFVAFAPQIPGYPGQPAVLDVGVSDNKTLLELVGVEMEMPNLLDNMELGNGYLASVGCLFIFGETAYLCATNNGENVLINLQSGELIIQAPERRYAKIESWRLVQSVNKDTQIIASYPPEEVA